MRSNASPSGLRSEDLLRALLLRSAPWAAGAGASTILAFLLIDGIEAAAAAVAGLGLVVFFFGVDVLVLRASAKMPPAFTALALLTEYVFKVLFIAALLWGLSHWTTLDLHASAVTVVVTTVTWVAALTVASIRTRSFYFDGPADDAPESASDDDRPAK
ncbi:MAG: hypothetical protein LH645_10305 [Actinomycetia bacterium]|nr:hypothetical protein [Actinomycetes bacterium]